MEFPHSKVGGVSAKGGLREGLDIVLWHESGLAVEGAAEPAGLAGGRHVRDDLVRLEGQLAVALAETRVQRADASVPQNYFMLTQQNSVPALTSTPQKYNASVCHNRKSKMRN